MKCILISLIIIVLSHSQTATAQFEPATLSIINRVNIDSLYENLRLLSGYQLFYLNGKQSDIKSRHRKFSGNSLASELISNKLKGFGLKVYQQDFDTDGRNIYAIQSGTLKPNLKVIICAHYDNMPSEEIAPGTDDNGTGTVAVLEAARILSKVQNNYTIIYALWDLEEQGLLGSEYYAQTIRKDNDSIIAVLNLDMIGWDKDNDGRAEIHTRDIKNSPALAQEMLQLNDDFSIGLNLKIVNPGNSKSDHASFWKNKFSAILLIESFSDFNIFYHQKTDNIDCINNRFLEKMVKLSVGMLAKTARSLNFSDNQNSKPTTFQLFKNYPNPFNPTTTIRYNLSRAEHVKLEIFDVLGKKIAVIVDQFQEPEYYEVKVDHSLFSNLSSGVYFYSLSTSREFDSQKMVFIK